jgi:hypothetical protein
VHLLLEGSVERQRRRCFILRRPDESGIIDANFVEKAARPRGRSKRLKFFIMGREPTEATDSSPTSAPVGSRSA